MKLDLNEIATHLRKRIEYDVNEPPLQDADSGVICVKPITGHLVFQNTGTLIVVRGDFETALQVECSRCLKAFSMEIQVPVEESFTISGTLLWDDDDDTDEEDFPEDAKEPLFEDNIFNLTELIRQSLAVSIPIRTLCSEDCKGICPMCGKDLGSGLCECSEIKTPSPFAALSRLLEKDESEEKK